MSFESGSMSFQRYAVAGDAPTAPTEELLGKLAANQLRSSDVGVPEDVEWGWAGPAHVLDATFDFEHCVFNDCVHIGLRIDTNKVPPAIVKAWQMTDQNAVAAANPSGFISKAQKRQVKEDLGRKIDEALRSGQYRRSTHIPLLWDVPNRTLYGPTSIAAREKLQELFSRTFALELIPLSSGHIALRELERQTKRGTYEDFVPTRFAKSLEDPDMNAEYPWTAKGDGAKDFLGNEFLLWLWFQTHKNGMLETTVGNVSVMFDRTLQLDCVFGQAGKDTLAATGPTRMPEAFEALRTGKVPRKAGLIIDNAAGQFNLTLTGESLVMTALKLPEIEKADTPRTLFEERIALLRDFSQTIDVMFKYFLLGRGVGWSQTIDTVKKWIKTGIKPNQA